MSISRHLLLMVNWLTPVTPHQLRKIHVFIDVHRAIFTLNVSWRINHGMYQTFLDVTKYIPHRMFLNYNRMLPNTISILSTAVINRIFSNDEIYSSINVRDLLRVKFVRRQCVLLLLSYFTVHGSRLQVFLAGACCSALSCLYFKFTSQTIALIMLVIGEQFLYLLAENMKH